MIGRNAEIALLTGMIAESRTGRGNAVVVHGEPGIGKSALLAEVARTAGDDVLVMRVTGVEAEAELPFAALHLLLGPARRLVPGLPEAQRAALLGAFGESRDGAPDRFLVGLAVLTLLADLAGDRPLLCLVDDAQWLDRASADALVFAARRMEAERITMILATRGDGILAGRGEELPVHGLAELRLTGLSHDDCARLLAGAAPDLVPEARERVMDEAEGNPLALVEFARALTPEERDGQLTPLPLRPPSLPLAGRLERSMRAAIRELPERTRLLLLVAAAEGAGDLEAILRAAGEAFGAGLPDLAPAERLQLVRVADGRLRFRHPLVKTAGYHEAPLDRRVTAHRALAGVLDGDEHADRRAWHLSAAAVGPDEETSGVLADAAVRAARRGSHALAATAYERAAQLTVDRRRRAHWLAAAAESALGAGQLARAGAAADRGLRLTDDPAVLARLSATRASVDAETAPSNGPPGDASAAGDVARHAVARPPAHTLIAAARGILASAPDEAASMLANAASDAWFAGDHASLGQAAKLLESLRPHVEARLVPLVAAVRGMERVAAGDPATGVPLLRTAIPGRRDTGSVAYGGGPVEQVVGTYAVFSALMTGDDDAACDLAAARVETCREHGLIGGLPHALQLLTQAQILRGRYAEAAESGAEAWRIAHDTGQAGRLRHLHGILARLAAVQGEDDTCRALARQAEGAAGERNGSGWGGSALTLLDLVRARHEEAAERMARLLRGPLGHTVIITFALPDHVEACARLGDPGRAEEAFARFASWAAAGGRPWAEAVTHRCRALLAPRGEAEDHYRAALAAHARGGREFEHARTRLSYGEWLRRARRRSDARAQLRAALDSFATLGAAPWAERAQAELVATGAHADMPALGVGPRPLDALTPQELQVVRLAATGATNRQIGARLFLSPRTVGFHLYKAYPKLGVSSRADLVALDLGPAPAGGVSGDTGGR